MMGSNVWLYKMNSALERSIIEHFKTEGLWDHVIWHDAEFVKTRYNNFDIKKHYDNHIYKPIPEHVYNKVYSYLMQYVDMCARWSPWSSSIYDQKNIHDHLNLFNRSINFIYRMLVENEIDLVIFNRAPHLGGDLILYLLAEQMNIKTLLLEQSKFPNKFFHYFKLKDFGEFKTSKTTSDYHQVEIEKEFKKDLWYMDGIYQKNKKSFKNFLRKHFRDEYRLFVESISHRGWEQSLYRYSLRKNYKKNATEIIDEEIDLEQPFIYFPLHLQPEQTTSVWGGKYVDQLLALERLSQKLPDSWYIYVKENPGQNFYMRGAFFYERLKAIPGVKVVPKSTDTYQLLSKSKFAATVTGTVGWEAITGGKNVLVFGWGVWYKSLPGVFHYHELMDINEIIGYQIDHNELEQKVSELQTKMSDGIVYLQEKEGYREFDEEDNKKTVINSLQNILYGTAVLKNINNSVLNGEKAVGEVK